MLEHLSAREQYLQDFHNRVAGATSSAFAHLPARMRGREYGSSYEILSSITLEYPAPCSVLDLACGDGHLLKLMSASNRSLRLTGVDLSQHDLAIAKAALPAEVRLLQERAQSMSLESASINLVLSHMALMLMEDVAQVLREIRRVLIPGGVLAAVVGRSFLLGPVNDVFMEKFTAIAKPELPPLPLMDRQTRSIEGWENLLSVDFDALEFADIDIPWTPTPEALWTALTATYDIDRLGHETRVRLRDSLLADWAGMLNPAGCLETGWGLRLMRAHAR